MHRNDRQMEGGLQTQKASYSKVWYSVINSTLMMIQYSDSQQSANCSQRVKPAEFPMHACAWMCARTCFQWIWSVDFAREKVTTVVDEMLWSISFRQWAGSNNHPNRFSHFITLFLYWPIEVPRETCLSSIWCRTQFMPLQFALTQGCTETLIYVRHSGNTGE